MTKRRKIAILVAGAAALAVAGAGGALAAGGAFSPQEESKAIIDDAAAQLGVEPSELSDALKQALENRIDEAVDAGRLTEEQADALKARLDSVETPLLFGRFGFGFGGHGLLGRGPLLGHVGPFASLETAASYLGLTQAELRSELADGKSLAEIAKAEGKSVDGLVQALVAAVGERIDQAVEDGRLTEAQAADLKEDLEERITSLVNHEPGSAWGRRGEFREQHGFRFGPGFGQFPEQAPFSGPRA